MPKRKIPGGPVQTAQGFRRVVRRRKVQQFRKPPMYKQPTHTYGVVVAVTDRATVGGNGKLAFNMAFKNVLNCEKWSRFSQLYDHVKALKMNCKVISQKLAILYSASELDSDQDQETQHWFERQGNQHTLEFCHALVLPRYFDTLLLSPPR